MKSIFFRCLLGLLCLFIHIPLTFAAPITRNSTAPVTLVEYYDYECPHCRRMAAIIERLQAQYPNLKVVYRVTPLFTSESRLVARFALAVKSQGEWEVLHRQLMASPNAPTLQDALRIARRLGLNAQNILRAMQRNSVQRHIAINVDLANTHAVQGKIYLPILVLGQSHGEGQPIVLVGEQPYSLLSAIVQHYLGRTHVPLAKNKKY